MFLFPATEKWSGKSGKGSEEQIISRIWWYTWLCCKTVHTSFKETPNIYNVSLESDIFPDQLKVEKLYHCIKKGIKMILATIGQ